MPKLAKCLDEMGNFQDQKHRKTIQWMSSTFLLIKKHFLYLQIIDKHEFV